MNNALIQGVRALEFHDELAKKLNNNRGVIHITGCLESQKMNLAAGISEGKRNTLIISPTELKAKALYEDMKLYDPDVFYYPARDMIFYHVDAAGNLLTRERLAVIRALTERKNVTVVTCVRGCMDRLLPFGVYGNNTILLGVGEELDLAAFSKKLVSLGYERCGAAESSGQFAVRGGIIDIYDPTAENPVRIELWGDEIDSIRSFDAETQRSIENLEETVIFPATEEMGAEEKNFVLRLDSFFFDYFNEDSLIFLDEPIAIGEAANAIFTEYSDAMLHRKEQGKTEEGDDDRLIDPTSLFTKLNKRNCIALSLLDSKPQMLNVSKSYKVWVKSVNSYNNQFKLLVEDLKKWKKAGYRTIILSPSRVRGRRLADELMSEDINAFYSDTDDRDLQPGEIMVLYGSAAKGFEYSLEKCAVITESDIFGSVKKKRVRKSYKGESISSFSELSIGDYVVHEMHGLGIYRGIEQIDRDGVSRDYIKIEYAKGSSLYVQASQLDTLQKYGTGEEHKNLKLQVLGGKEWNNTKERVRKAVKEIAGELVKLYASRQEANGFVFSEDTVWQREFEEMFPYEETDDQITAIEQTKADMQSTKIMDRLICGDVGYGKTEVALRAAFKAVQDNKQVVMLVPTTILAQQHYMTFRQRLKDFPVNVDLLCRFRTPTEQKKTIKDLKSGQCDIVIGTHKVLNSSIVYKDLGLLIIDEEQRFGVTHKEKIKQLKNRIDVLTLSATPIPRTLHMSLVGIRDMSLLREPPLDRMPIQTYVCEYDEELVREAINRELARNGQVYFVSNRIAGIAELTNRLRDLVPEAVIEYAHGRMNERELEGIMYSFINGEIDVLVSTTIIETGMDISNVNTMIIQDSDRMGLSQLYQLRGRIGRANRTAYAFLMYRKNKVLKEDAAKRLHAITEFSDLGSGIKIAMRDLEIRGAGNLLGAEQSGHMESVGYDLYCKMLKEAVLEAKGIEETKDFETLIELPLDAFIPGKYIPDEKTKLGIYKRIAAVSDKEEMEDMTEELTDRFGDPPRAVMNLLAIAYLKAAARRVYINEIKPSGDEIRFNFDESARLASENIPELIKKHEGRLHLVTRGGPYFLYKPGAVTDRRKGLIYELQMVVDSFNELLAL